jgi:ACT domain-containing protein
MKKVPLAEKDILTPEEAIQYFGLSRRKFYRWMETPHCFVAYFKTRKIILRLELEKYFLKYPQEKEALANGKPRTKA